MGHLGNQNAVGNHGGRPPKYKEEFADLARKFCMLGATNEDLARVFEVNVVTIKRWVRDVPEFCASVFEGRELADAEVAHKLYRRAIGYSHPDVHISTYQGEVTTTPIVKHYPPDTPAAIMWLTNRQREKWKSVHRVENTGPDGAPLAPPVFNVSFDAVPSPKDDEPDQK